GAKRKENRSRRIIVVCCCSPALSEFKWTRVAKRATVNLRLKDKETSEREAYPLARVRGCERLEPHWSVYLAVKCRQCGDTGRMVCGKCDGTGRIQCIGGCSGTGKEGHRTRPRCEGKGGYACFRCDGSGTHLCLNCRVQLVNESSLQRFHHPRQGRRGDETIFARGSRSYRWAQSTSKSMLVNLIMIAVGSIFL